VQEDFGGLVMIYGTLMTSVIALLIAVPVSFGIALFLTELSPGLAQATIGYGHRVAGSHSVDCVRHVGLLVFSPICRPMSSSRCSNCLRVCR
jgi:phosphate transport system permease protein